MVQSPGSKSRSVTNMPRFFIDWGLKVGGEFIVEATSEKKAITIARDVITRALELEFLDAEEAEMSVEKDTEPVDKHMKYYRRNSEGRLESFTPMRRTNNA